MGIHAAKGDNVLSLTVHKDESVFEILQSEWNNLLTQSRSNRIFSTWEWQSTWWSAYQPGQLWILAVRNDNAELLGLAPFFIDDKQTVHFVGCEDVTDYLDVIAHQDFEQEVYARLAQYLAENKGTTFEAIELCNLPVDSPTLTGLQNSLSAQGFVTDTEMMDVCPIIELGDEWESYLANLDKKQRHEIRRKMRRASGENVDWYIVGDDHNLADELEIFLNLMATASTDKAEFLQDEDNIAFFKQIVPLFYEKGWLQLATITMNGEPAASYLNFDYGNEIGVYNSGLNIDVGGTLSLGIVLLAHLIQHAIGAGRKRFDLLRGNETYKYRMGGQDDEIYRLIAN